MSNETLILKWLTHEWEFANKVFIFIKKEYFESSYHAELFELVNDFVIEYKRLPTKTILLEELLNKENIRSNQLEPIVNLLENEIFNGDPCTEDPTWVENYTEKWCQDRAVYLAIFKAIEILDKKNTQFTKDAIPSILQDALAVSFNTDIGFDYFEDTERRLQNIEDDFKKIPFELEYFNLITKGGLPEKTLTCFLGTTNIGKSLMLCNLASDFVRSGHNVLYITGEMSENQAVNRIDGSMMNIDINTISSIGSNMYLSLLNGIKAKTRGKLIVKEYPTSSVHVGHFRALLNELDLKKKFKPDFIMIDYLNCFLSSRYKVRSTNDSYAYVKGIAEELRSLAMEYSTRVITATQLNREGAKKSDISSVELTDTSESWGLNAVVDLMIALLSNKDLVNEGKILAKLLKNRIYSSMEYPHALLGISREKQKIFNIELNDDNFNKASTVKSYSSNFDPFSD